MVKKIIFSFLFVCLFIALVLALAGVTAINFDTEFYTWVNGIVYKTNQLEQYSIPTIPDIPLLTTGTWYLDLLTFGVNVWVQTIRLLNVIIKILNSLIYIFKFLIVLIQSVQEMPQIFATTQVAII